VQNKYREISKYLADSLGIFRSHPLKHLTRALVKNKEYIIRIIVYELLEKRNNNEKSMKENSNRLIRAKDLYNIFFLADGKVLRVSLWYYNFC
jgi:hypothetical protein